MILALFNTLCVLGCCSICAANIYKHLKNYRKPMDQRLIVRILLIVPMFGVGAWMRLYSSYVLPAMVIKTFRELYEALVIYFFYSLLTSLLGGEREIIFETTGKPPVRYLFLSLDISDPHTFWVIKKLIMQFVWLKPVIIILMAVNKSQWIGVLLIISYNIVITLALNALMAFWICLKSDLEPYRVVLKFLSVKMIIFFSYWQSLALYLLNTMHMLSDDSLIFWNSVLLCAESLIFAYIHWLAFPASDFCTTFMFGFARLRIDAALRDAFGFADLVNDFRRTLFESRYGHRHFDSVEAVMDHPNSQTRSKRLAAGLRYKNGGRSKYWLPDSSLKGLLQRNDLSRTLDYGATMSPESSAYSMIAMGKKPHAVTGYQEAATNNEDQTPCLNAEDQYSEGEEELYELAKQVYGDYNYPVATVRETEEYTAFQDRLRRQQILDSI